jgi:branched-chain amino acid transport system ATP-binding protein
VSGTTETAPAPLPALAERTPLLQARELTCVFGGLTACDGVGFTVPERSIVSLIGPNGAGKTTFFNMLTGLYKPTAGEVLLGTRPITGARPDRIVAAGVARTYQNIRLFSTMSARENVLVGQHARLRSGLVRAILPGFVNRATRREEARARARADELLAYAGVPRDCFDRLATTLSYGDQRRVEIARALVSDPQLLLLDEPAAGMNPSEAAQLGSILRKIQAAGHTILIVEHNMRLVMSVADEITVLSAGKIIATGTPTEIQSDSAVISAYLGNL